jgi:hypothetical protein
VADQRKELKKPEFVFKPRQNGTPTPLPLSLPPPRLDSSLGAGTTDRRGVTTSSPTIDTSSDGKVAALRTYRSACGLCPFCAEKWARGHKCAQQVQLQVVQELWGMLSMDSNLDAETESVASDSKLHMLLSSEAVSHGTSS